MALRHSLTFRAGYDPEKGYAPRSGLLWRECIIHQTLDAKPKTVHSYRIRASNTLERFQVSYTQSV